MKNILLAASSEKNLTAFETIIKTVTDANIISSIKASEVRDILKTQNVDVVVINTPLSDEQGLELSLYVADIAMYQVLLITGSDTHQRFSEKLEEHGIISIGRPIDKKTFTCALQNSLTVGNRIRALREKNIELQESLEEIKLVNRAKAMLMQNLNMKEAQAHRYIEKQAMDLRISRKTVAQNILKTYYNK